ncbi:CaiB/BaiF CoA transferase family protein [Jatrophihabitans sp. DSM 45814]
MQRVLSDVRVIELAAGATGSYCGKLFADLGADVVKVERPQGDPLRRAVAGRKSDVSGAFLHLNTNKRSAVLDPAVSDVADLWDLLAEADVVIEAREGGSLAQWGIGWREFHERMPTAVVVGISGFGADGPYADYKSTELIAQAMSGTMLLQATDQDPLRLPGHLGACFSGSMAAVGALGAIAFARSTGQGSYVDSAAVEALASMPSRATPLLTYQYRGAVANATQNSNPLTLIPTGVFPCADGYVGMMSTPQQLKEMLEVLDNDELKAAFARPDAFERGETKEALDAALYPWLFAHTRAEATAAAQSAGWPLAGLNSPDEVLHADHLHQRGFWVHADDPRAGSVDLPGPAHRFQEGGWALRGLAPELGQQEPFLERETHPGPDALQDHHTQQRRPSGGATKALPLEGIRVVDMTTVWSGPYATMLLADLGAEVIRVENPFVLPPTTKGYQARPTISNLGLLGSGYGPAAPGRPDRPWNRHALNNSVSRNKLSCTIDTRRPEGRELLMRLVEKADLFVENFKATGLTRMGIQVSEMQARNPRLVVLRLPPTGLSGDWSSYTGFGTQFDALTGLLWICGHRDSDLTTSPATTYMDAATGPAAAFAAMAALRYRDQTGRGQLVELAQSENVLNHLGDVYVDYQLGTEPVRMGNRDRDRAPQGLYRCQGDNRWLAISVGDDEEWGRLAAVIGRAELAHDGRFADLETRQRNHDELDAIIGAWAAEQEVTAAFHLLQGAGVAAAPLMDDTMFCTDPHIQARGWMRPLNTTDVGTHPHPSQPYRGVPQAWRRGSPALGEDNEYVYKDILGVTDDEFEQYRESRILAEDYLAPDGSAL